MPKSIRERYIELLKLRLELCNAMLRVLERRN